MSVEKIKRIIAATGLALAIVSLGWQVYNYVSERKDSLEASIHVVFKGIDHQITSRGVFLKNDSIEGVPKSAKISSERARDRIRINVVNIGDSTAYVVYVVLRPYDANRQQLAHIPLSGPSTPPVKLERSEMVEFSAPYNPCELPNITKTVDVAIGTTRGHSYLETFDAPFFSLPYLCKTGVE